MLFIVLSLWMVAKFQYHYIENSIVKFFKTINRVPYNIAIPPEMHDMHHACF